MGSWTSLQATTLSAVFTQGAATHVGNQALFGGGFNDSSYYPGKSRSEVDAYNASLGKTVVDPLSIGRGKLVATHVGNHALFAGGTYYTSDSYMASTYSKNIDVYDSSLTHLATITPTTEGMQTCATHIGNYALFTKTDGSVDVYDSSLTYSKAADLPFTNTPVGTHNDNHAIFIYYASQVTTYNKSLTKTVLAESANSDRFTSNSAATHVGEYALFSGGSNLADAYDNSLTHSSPDRLSRTNYSNFAATHVSNHALFGGGYYGNSDSTYNIPVDIYDTSLTRSQSSDAHTTYRRYYLSATNIGNYALFAGGRYSTSTMNTVDAIAYKAYTQYGYTLNALYIPVYD